MRNLIESVANLTTLRNRDELEFIVASVMFDLIAPSQLTMWRLVSRSGELRIQERARLMQDQVVVQDPLIDFRDLPPLASHGHMRACYDSKAPLVLKQEEHGRHGYLFPVTSELDVVGFLEIDLGRPLHAEQERLICGLLRIYRNYLRVLDYGECDELTGLPNRKTFHEHFRNLVSPQAQRSDSVAAFEYMDRQRSLHAPQPPWLAVADIDFFKRINDRFGHAYGDEVLVLMARLMRGCFHEGDRVFRFGGEEFVVILGHMEEREAEQALERFRATVEAFDFPQVGRVTISIGLTHVAQGDNGSNAFGRADEALYIAKQRGRNQVCFYERLVTESALKPKSVAAEEVELF